MDAGYESGRAAVTHRRAARALAMVCAIIAPTLVCLAACERTERSNEPPIQELSKVPEFALTDRDQRPFGTKQLAGKPYVATFMFTRCPSVCPRVTARMKQVDDAAKAHGLDLQMVSISVDPEHDDPAALQAYAEEHGATAPNWHFLTGEHQHIAQTAEQGFKIGVSGKPAPDKPHLGITHGSHLVLVNPRGYIVGYFPSSADESVRDVVETAQRL